MRVFRSTVAAILAVATAAGAGPISTDWIPANAGVMWFQTGDANYPLSVPRQPPGETNGAWWMTRRLASSPHLQGVTHMGSFFHGLYVSSAGGAWANLTPGCLLPVNKPAVLPMSNGDYAAARNAVRAITGLETCGIEGIAYDPLIPARIYVATYDVTALVGTNATLGDGGVYVTENLGATWRKLRGGIRGNGLAVARNSLIAGPVIIAGYIQSGSSVGSTPSNGSMTISRDGGRTWADIVLPPSGCADTIQSSQRITPTIVFNPLNINQVFAGTNAGLYVSSDGGTTWTLNRVACAGIWGIAVSADGQTVFIGDKDGRVWRAPTSTLAFTALATLGAGKVQDLRIDPLDPGTMFAAMWSGGGASVYRIDTVTGANAALDTSLLRERIPLDQGWPSGVPKPYPLAFEMADGTAPSLFLGGDTLGLGTLFVSTIFKGAFERLE